MLNLITQTAITFTLAVVACYGLACMIDNLTRKGD